MPDSAGRNRERSIRQWRYREQWLCQFQDGRAEPPGRLRNLPGLTLPQGLQTDRVRAGRSGWDAGSDQAGGSGRPIIAVRFQANG